MTENIYGIMNVTDSYFYQNFDATLNASMFTLTQKSTSWLYVIGCIVRATVSSNLDHNYGLVGAIEEGAQTTIS